MSDERRASPRAKMSPQERSVRSRLAQLLSQKGFLRGTLLVRQRVCGKPGCKCTRGRKHESLYLVRSEGGRTRQLYVPKEFEARVRQWVGHYHQAREFMDQISRIYWDRVRKRQD